jgi:hypothetical protein
VHVFIFKIKRNAQQVEEFECDLQSDLTDVSEQYGGSFN